MNILKNVAFLVEQLEDITGLLNFGFEKIEVSCSTSSYIFINFEIGVVVKRNFTFGNYEKLNCAIPTVFVEKEYNADKECDISGSCSKRVLIQPLADLTKQKDAYSFLSEQFKEEIDLDLRIFNCAHYEGKPVLIDW